MKMKVELKKIEEYKPKRGRPSTNFDKKSYQRQYMADKRQAKKLGVSVREYRASEAERTVFHGR